MRSPTSSSSSKRAISGNRSQPSSSVTGVRRWLGLGKWGHVLTGLWVLAAAAATSVDLGVVQLLERQTQTLFFELRGIVIPPAEVVILAIDETSLSQAEFYRSDPVKYAELAPLQTWPWRREAYATVIERLMQAGARSVSLDVIFSTESSHGEADDQRLAETLARYADRVVLAAQYTEVVSLQGVTMQLTLPLPLFRTEQQRVGSINFLLEPDSRIHRFGDRLSEELATNLPENQSQALLQLATDIPTFATASLEAAQQPYPEPWGDHIFFYGPAQTFTHIPFWQVLDSTTWETSFQSGEYFKDKIVLIGSTATVHQDFHSAPFADNWLYPVPMPGVEVHANAIATLLQGRSIADAFPQAPLRGLVVLLGVGMAGYFLSRPRQPLLRWVWAMGLAIAWIGIGYVTFVQGRLIIPTAVPAGALMLSGLSQLMVGTAKEQQRKKQLRNTLRQYATSPIVQEIISQQDDLFDLLRERELALSGTVLNNRYQISRVLGSGGFSETYTAHDLQLPSHPICVVKQLKIANDNPSTLRLAQRLFATEAETLDGLGQHDQIPKLLAYFDENQEFYLVQEFIQGHPLTNELVPGKPASEARVVSLLRDLLPVLEFVHSQGVIHRDLKPSNIMRRRSDGRLVLIDFGIAKKITTQLIEQEDDRKFTIGVGTPGYMPSEQSAGRPHFNSDLYALGLIAIEALTGRSPHFLKHDPITGELIWAEQAPHANPELVEVLQKMVRHDFTKRYQTASEALGAIAPFAGHNEPLIDEQDIISRDITVHADGTQEFLEEETEEADQDTVTLPDDWMNA